MGICPQFHLSLSLASFGPFGTSWAVWLHFSQLGHSLFDLFGSKGSDHKPPKPTGRSFRSSSAALQSWRPRCKRKAPKAARTFEPGRRGTEAQPTPPGLAIF